MNKKMNVLAFIPDSIDENMGGMGEHIKNIIAHSSHIEDLYFYIIGLNGNEKKGKNYSYYPVNYLSKSFINKDKFSELFLEQSLFVQKFFEIKPKIDIVHAFDWSTWWAAKIISSALNIPLVFGMHLSIRYMYDNINAVQSMQYGLASKLEYDGLLNANAIIQVSQEYAKLFSNPIFDSKTFIIPNGIDLSEWKQTRKINLPGDHPIKVVYIGRFAQMKNVLSILNADIPKEIDVIFIGGVSGSDRDILDKVINECKKKDYFHYVGPKYGQEKIDYLMSADAVIFPSTHEPFGIVGLEALASRSILLASFVDGMKDYLTEDVAINCGTTPETISKALYRLVNMSKNEKQDRINRGIDVCKKFSWRSSANKLKFVYDLVLGKYK